MDIYRGCTIRIIDGNMEIRDLDNDFMIATANPYDEVFIYFHNKRWVLKGYIPQNNWYYIKKFFKRGYWKVELFLRKIYGDVHSNL